METEFGISKLGFLPESCVEKLPELTPFIALEYISDNLPELNRSFTLKEAITKLQIIPKHAIIELSEGEQRRLYVILAMIIHSLMHGPKARWDLLDDCSTVTKLLSGNISRTMRIIIFVRFKIFF